MTTIATRTSEASNDWSRFLRIGAAAAVIGGSFLAGACERSDAEYRAAAEAALRPTVREVITNSTQFEGKEVRFDLAPIFVTDQSSIYLRSRYKRGHDYLDLSLRYEVTQDGSTIPLVISGRVRLGSGSYHPGQFLTLTTPYRIPAGTHHVLGTVKLFPDNNRPYIEVARTYPHLD